MLARLGLEFRVIASGVAEQTSGRDPVTVVEANAAAKARDVASRAGIPDGGAVLAADTEVILDGRVLGKPVDAEAARATLARLSGRTHEVITGVVLITAGGHRSAHEITRVTIRPLSAQEITWYIGTGEWRDRAGGYAIQEAGAALCASIDGDVANVIGLPLARVAGMLLELGLWPANQSGVAAG